MIEPTIILARQLEQPCGFCLYKPANFSLPQNTLSVSLKPVSPKFQLLGPQIKLFILCSLDTNYCSRAGTWEKKTRTKPGKQRHTGTCEGEWWGLTGTCISYLFLESFNLNAWGVPTGRADLHLAGGAPARKQGNPGDRLWHGCAVTATHTPWPPSQHTNTESSSLPSPLQQNISRGPHWPRRMQQRELWEIQFEVT